MFKICSDDKKDLSKDDIDAIDHDRKLLVLVCTLFLLIRFWHWIVLYQIVKTLDWSQQFVTKVLAPNRFEAFETDLVQHLLQVYQIWSEENASKPMIKLSKDIFKGCSEDNESHNSRQRKYL